jgi:serine/threonine-protein kinase
MGLVWRALHEELGTTVAVKVLAPGAENDPSALRRFRREARAVAALRCPHVVDVRDYGLEDGVPYIVMEYLEGESLASRLSREPGPTLAEMSAWVAQAGVALDYAHTRGFLHRDIKPSNLFLCQTGSARVLKVLDFGIVKSLDEADGGESTVVGSPGYLSPEQARGEGLDHTTDLWSLGAVLYRAVTSVEPFASASLAATVERICLGQVPAPSTLVPSLPPEFDGFFERALCRDVSQRFGSGAELADAFASIAARAPDFVLPVATSERPSSLAPRVESTLSWESFRAHTRTARAKSLKTGLRKRLRGPLLAVVVAAFVLIALSLANERLAPRVPTERARVAAHRQGALSPRLASTIPSEPASSLPSPTAEPRRVEPPTAARPERAARSRSAREAPAVAKASLDSPPRTPAAAPSAQRDPIFGLPAGTKGESDASPRATSVGAFDAP